MDPPRRYSRSISQLKKVAKCGEQFRLEKFSDPKPEKAPAAWLALGTALHATFTEWEFNDRDGSKLDVQNMFAELYDDAIESLREEQPNLYYWNKPPNTSTVETSIKNYRARGLEKDVPWYYDRCINSEWEVAEVNHSRLVEVEFEYDYNGLIIKGFIDRVQWWPSEGYYTIEDTKTGSPSDDDYDPRQLKMYAIAAEKLFNIEIAYGRYWYTKIDRGSKWFKLQEIDTLTTLDEYARLDTLITERLFLTNPGKHCQLCSVKNLCNIGKVT